MKRFLLGFALAFWRHVAMTSAALPRVTKNRCRASRKKMDGGYKTFTDFRNGRSYYYITITGTDTVDNVASVTAMAVSTSGQK